MSGPWGTAAGDRKPDPTPASGSFTRHAEGVSETQSHHPQPSQYQPTTQHTYTTTEFSDTPTRKTTFATTRKHTKHTSLNTSKTRDQRTVHDDRP